MPSYKLTYFNGRGRAETARLLFAKAGVEYEDHRIQREEWPSLKDKTPFGSIPLLEVDGVQLAQSYAIVSFLAKKFGLHGKNAIDEGRVDMVCLCVEDLANPLVPIMIEQDAKKKEELKKKYEEQTLPNGLKFLNRLLEANGGNFFVGKEMSVADIHFANFTNGPAALGITADLSAYPKLQALKTKVEADPKIAEWIKKRPQTPF